MKRPVVAVLCGALVCASVSVPAHAETRMKERTKKKKLPRRKAKFVSYLGWLGMTVKWRDVVNTDIRRKLLSGLPTVIVTRAYVFVEGKAAPVALSVKTCRVVYDLWDEVFRIRMKHGGHARDTVAVNVEGVLRRCAEARRMAVVKMKVMSPKKPHFVGVLVEVNPLSKAMMERIRRWVSRPHGAGAVGPGDSLFGSFVGLFITKVPDADRMLAFRTQVFVPKKVPLQKPKKKRKAKPKPARKPKPKRRS